MSDIFIITTPFHSKELPVPAPPLINWKKVQKQLAWDVVLLLGGGFALANMCQATGLSRAIGDLIGGVVENLWLVFEKNLD